MTKIPTILIWLISLIGLYGTFGLVQNELTTGDICPKIMGIPACFIIFACFLLVLLGHSSILKKWSWVYFIGVGVALSIASYGSLGELLGFAECPKTSDGIPMCFLSFGLFLALLLLSSKIK